MKRLLSVARRFIERKPVDIHKLDEHGLRAPFRTDAEWRELLKDEFSGHVVSYWPARLFTDSALAELSLEFYKAGSNLLRVDIPMGGGEVPDEPARERPVEDKQPTFGPN